jgi:hypothetical protein
MKVCFADRWCAEIRPRFAWTSFDFLDNVKSNQGMMIDPHPRRISCGLFISTIREIEKSRDDCQRWKVQNIC